MNAHRKIIVASLCQFSVLLTLGLSTAVHAQNLITDPGFENSSPAWNFTDISGITQPGHTGTNSAYINGQEPSIPGSVSQTVNTTPGQSYTVDFWLKAAQDFGDGGGGYPGDGYEVTVSFGNTNGFAQNYPAPPTFDWTEYSFTAVATASTSTFTFSVQDIASTFFLDDVSVTATNSSPTPTVSIYPAVEINWLAQSNTTYQVQWSTVLSPTNWQNLGAPVTGTGTNVSVFDSSSSPQKFYQVEIVPQN